MKLAIIGSRTFDDWNLLDDTLCRYWGGHGDGSLFIDEIISGGAKGADRLAAQWATEQGVKLTELLPDWDKHGKKAGLMRNEDIVKECDMLLAFWDGVSRGTQNSLGHAKRLKKPTMIVYF